MRGSNPETDTAKQIKLIRKYLKLKIVEDNVSFRNHEEQRHQVYDLIKRTLCSGESHSALMIGPKGSGKTTLINSVLNQLAKEVDLENDAIIVKLNGLLHSDEKVALKSITAQMQLENAVGDQVFGSFAESLSFLFTCLRSADKRSKSMVFLLEDFHLFCRSGKTQTLLYNLFDNTHSDHSPMCVIGVTNRLDVMELLEKRVKSRFSHRHILVLPNEGHRTMKEAAASLLSVPLSRGRKGTKATTPTTEHSVPAEVLTRCQSTVMNLDAMFVRDWNAHVNALLEDERVENSIEKFCYYTVNEQVFRNVLFYTVSKLSPRKPFIDPAVLTSAIDNTVSPEHRVKLLQSLSILELSLVIAMKHGMEIFDWQPMNFEMVLHRYTKFANANSSTQSVPRPVILKAFEHLQALEIILPIRNIDSMSNATETTASRVQKEYKLYTLAVPVEEITEAVKGFKALPTEISHWYTTDFYTVSKLSPRKPFIDPAVLTSAIDNTVSPEHRVKLLQSLSILELSLVIAMKHGMEIFDWQPMNFEMVLHRYTKFANANSSTQSVPRPVILKAFEHLQALEIILPIRNIDSMSNATETTASRVQKEYKLYTLAVPVEEITEAVKGFKALPTEISHWYTTDVC